MVEMMAAVAFIVGPIRLPVPGDPGKESQVHEHAYSTRDHGHGGIEFPKDRSEQDRSKTIADPRHKQIHSENKRLQALRCLTVSKLKKIQKKK
jgi:hypothetical protein